MPKLLLRAVLFVLLAIAAVVSATREAAAQSLWYITGGVGALLRSDASRSTTITGTVEKPVALPVPPGFPPFTILVPTATSGPGTNTATFDAGVFVNLGLGYKLPLGFRIEGDLAYAHYRDDSVNPLSTNGTFPTLNGSRLTLQSGGVHDQYEAAALGFYDLPVAWPVVPFVGAGLGVVNDEAEDGHFAGPGGVPKFVVRGGNPTYPATIVEVGVTIAIDARWAVVPSYRFEHVFVRDNALADHANTFKLGVRYSF
jgi:opacity protein-like surface antigen